MRQRPSARILLLDEESRVLLFRFVFKSGESATQDYWATPGGALEEGETFAQAAQRELFEETGIVVETVGESVAEAEFALYLQDGEQVMAQEQFFIVHLPPQALSFECWTALERKVIVEHRWWSATELATTKEVFYPENLLALLTDYC